MSGFIVTPFNQSYKAFVFSLMDSFSEFSELKQEYSRILTIMSSSNGLQTLVFSNEMSDDLNRCSERIHSRDEELCHPDNDLQPSFFKKLRIPEIYNRLNPDEKVPFWNKMAELVKTSTNQRILGKHSGCIADLIASQISQNQGQPINPSEITKRMAHQMMGSAEMRARVIGMLDNDNKDGNGFFQNMSDMIKGYGLTVPMEDNKPVVAPTDNDDQTEEEEEEEDDKKNDPDRPATVMKASDLLKENAKKKKRRQRNRKPKENPIALMAAWLDKSILDDKSQVNTVDLQKQLNDTLDTDEGKQIQNMCMNLVSSQIGQSTPLNPAANLHNLMSSIPEMASFMNPETLLHSLQNADIARMAAMAIPSANSSETPAEAKAFYQYALPLEQEAPPISLASSVVAAPNLSTETTPAAAAVVVVVDTVEDIVVAEKENGCCPLNKSRTDIEKAESLD